MNNRMNSGMKPDPLPVVVQFHDNLQQISPLLERRFSLRRIWQQLSSEGKYSGDYSHFCRLARKEFDLSNQGVRNSAASTASKEPTQESEGPLMFLGDLVKNKQ